MADSGRRRLTAWKEIASYMDRDVRTVMRWEKTRELPVHRGPGGKSGVVFADTDELDAWMRGGKAIEEPLVEPAPAVVASFTGGHRREAIVAAAAVVLAAIIGGWQLFGFTTNGPSDSVVMTDSAIVATSADGVVKWRHDFTGELASPPFGRRGNPIERLAGDGTLAATSETVPTDTLNAASGQLFWFDPAGAIRRTFAFDDHLRFGSRVYSAPWALSDFQVDNGSGDRLIAVSGHHHEWWPSVVTVLDAQWRRKATFVNAGWIEQMYWLPGGHLAIGGFSNPKDGAMVALLDARAMRGQSPAPPNSEFDCTDCGPDRPLRYVVMPRSEVNRVSSAPFNRVLMSARPGGLLIRTLELQGGGAVSPADALYEFTPQLDLVQASYSDRYWEAHRELERLGKITHTREQCPDRDGPRQIEVWEPATGWRMQSIHQAAAPRGTTASRRPGR